MLPNPLKTFFAISEPKIPTVILDDHVQFLVYQILRGMKYVHLSGIVYSVSRIFIFMEEDMRGIPKIAVFS